jgi:tetratricopeptide (TPR) repeat protein
MLGEGGMGEVWLADQTEPVRRRVALKVIKRGMDTDRVVARFQAERQALAMMDHPCVASVFEAGSTPSGRPYFVMEYVDGVPITTHCDRRMLTTRGRLELFVQVCEGVQHAHQKAVIHRDLKPGNVLVSIRNDRAIPKIIDFGVAKATAQKLTERTVYTEMGVLIGTPEYMSPEQAELGGQHVDTRTDVYSLGMMLYEILAGALPFDPKELRESGYEGIRQRIREEEPPRPSTRVSAAGGDSLEIAKRRSVDPSTLRRQLRGDLDWIVMKALEKDRTRRYATPLDLAADIDRYLAEQPVLAGPPSTVYKVRKFVRRHRFGVGLAAVVAVALAVGLAGTVWQAVRATRAEAEARHEAENARVQAARAGQTSEFLQSMLESVNPEVARGRDTEVLNEILEGAVERAGEELADQPEVEATVLGTVGRTYRSLGRFEEAEELLRQALDTQVAASGERHPEVAFRIAEVASLMRDLGRLDEAEEMHRHALEMRRALLPEDDPVIAESLNNLALVLWDLGRPAEAEPLYRQALAIYERSGGVSEEMADGVNNLSLVVRDQGRLDEAVPLARQALEMWREVGGDDHPGVAVALNNLARLLVAEGEYDQAIATYTESLELRRKVYGDEHPRVALVMHNLGDTLRKAGRREEAREMLRASLDLHRRTLPEGHPNLAWPMTAYATLLVDLGEPGAAEPLLREAVGLRRAALPSGDWRTAASESELGYCLGVQGRYAEAEPLLLAAYDALKDNPGRRRETRRTLRRIVRLYEAWGRDEEAGRYQAVLESESERSTGS